MARTRYIKPGFCKNEQLAALGPFARLLFAGLWTIADKEGRLEDRPTRIKVECLPYDDVDVDELLSRLANGYDPFIVRYQVDGRHYIQIVKWHENQSPHHTEKDSVIPEIPEGYEAPLDNGEVTSSTLKGTKVPRLKVSKGGAGGKPQITSADVPCPPEMDTPEVRDALDAWLAFKAKKGQRYVDGTFLGNKVSEFVRAGPVAFVAAVKSSIGNNYSGIFPAKEYDARSNQSTRVGAGQRHRG